MSNKRALAVGFLTAGLSVGVLASVISPAAAQGNPVGGEGNAYFMSGALNPTGAAQQILIFGDNKDEVFFGDWYDSGEDLPMVRRGNVFFVPDAINNSVTKSVFAYGDAGDTVLVGDWDGDGTDSIAIRRGNHFFVKNENTKSGKADSEFFYGDAGDTVLVGNWNGVVENTPSAGEDYNGDDDYTDPATPAYGADVDPDDDLGFDANGNGDYTDTGDRQPGTGVDNNKDGDFDDDAQEAVPAEVAPGESGKGDTIMIQRGNKFFVKNAITTGNADYTFYFGDAGDDILVGDWATPAKPETATLTATEAQDSDGADQLAVRRGFNYFQSSELEAAKSKKTNPTTIRQFAYGDAGDTVFVAALNSDQVDEYGRPVDGGSASIPGDDPIEGDGLGVRRVLK